jgi:hypothetical protein
VSPTRPATLLTAGVAGFVLGFGLTSLLDQLGYGLPRVSWVAVVLLAFLASLLLVGWRRVRAWVSGDRPQEPGDALTMGRFVALAKAGSMFGALMCGAYLGLAAVGLDRVETTYGRGHVLWAVAGAAAAGAVLVSALLLERALQLPGDDEDGASGAS